MIPGSSMNMTHGRSRCHVVDIGDSIRVFEQYHVFFFYFRTSGQGSLWWHVIVDFGLILNRWDMFLMECDILV